MDTLRSVLYRVVGSRRISLGPGCGLLVARCPLYSVAPMVGAGGVSLVDSNLDTRVTGSGTRDTDHSTTIHMDCGGQFLRLVLRFRPRLDLLMCV